MKAALPLVLTVSALALVLLAGCAVPGGEPPQAAESPSAVAVRWERLGEEALAALQMGDDARAAAALAAMEGLDPGRPVVHHLRAVCAERAGDWGRALRQYGSILTAADLEPDSRWNQFAAARWVRVRRGYNEERVRAVLEDPDAEIKPGRCLVLPLEPIFLDRVDSQEAERLQALGEATAGWLVGALALVPGVEPVDLPVVHLLRRALTSGARSAAGEGRPVATAPITTVLGVTTRLARLRPQGPPPGAPADSLPPRYLLDLPGGEWTARAAAALAHFQADHGLPATGQVDPETRASLERAYRSELRAIAPESRLVEDTDLGRTMARMLGVEAMLSGTLEPDDQGGVRWQMAWVAPGDGSLLGETLEGVLPRDHFEEAFARLLRLALLAAPWCDPPGGCAELNLPAAPSREGAEALGRALYLLEEERDRDAAWLFAEAARKGGGPQAAWYAMAWQPDDAALERLAAELVDAGFYGPVELSPGLLERDGRRLAAALTRAPAAMPLWGWDPGVTYVPVTGWIVVHGSLEGR